jgi:hypothetical protein
LFLNNRQLLTLELPQLSRLLLPRFLWWPFCRAECLSRTDTPLTMWPNSGAIKRPANADILPGKSWPYAHGFVWSVSPGITAIYDRLSPLSISTLDVPDSDF